MAEGMSRRALGLSAGAGLTAAIKRDFDRASDKTHPYDDLGLYPLTSLLGPIQGTEVIAPMTVAVHLSRPFAPVLNMCASFIGFAADVSPNAVKQYGCHDGGRPAGVPRFIRFEQTGSYPVSYAGLAATNRSTARVCASLTRFETTCKV